MMGFRASSVRITLWLTLVLVGVEPAASQPATPPPEDHAAETPDSVMASLRRVFGWYQEARIAMQSFRGVVDTDLTPDEEQTARHALQRAFDTARARAAALARQQPSDTTATPSDRQPPDKRTQLQAAIQQDELDIARLRRRVRTATAATRPALEHDLAAAANRLELDRVQLDFATKLQGFEAAVPKDEADLSHQIQALQDAVPELGATRAAPAVVTTAPSSGSTSGTWALLHRLVALQHTRSSLAALSSATDGMVRSTNAELLGTQQRVRPLAARLHALAQDPGANGSTLAAGEQEFHDLLERGKLLGAVLLPLREESALLHQYATDVQRWKRAVDGDIGQVLRGLAIECLGVAIVLAVVGVGAGLWRFAVVRYVTNAYHKRLLLGARRVVVLTAIVLVLVFHFTSELTALVAALGFAAAGIALALQNVILAVAGYVSIMAPNGIRAGDRVSLQGPFGYVHGEVIEIGVVRTRLQELAGEPLQPTGRIVVFPNSVVFTGSFFKHPPPEVRRSQVASETGDPRGQR
jgi:hypothetical protein